MKQEKLLAGALIAFCAVAAVGSFFTRQPAKEERAQTQAFESGLFAGTADIAQLDIQGMILDSGSPGGFGGGSATSAEAIFKAIERIREDDVPVVLLNINSPGGTAAAADAIYQELLRLKRDKKTKIVASFGDMAASGGYYVACAADTIVANPATLTGSIGVIIHNQNLEGLMGKIGVDNTVIKSGPHKDILSPFRPMQPSERKMLQAIVDDTYRGFLDAVSTGRHMPVEQVRPLADGRIFTGRQALGVKLVDKLGTYVDAKAEARRLAGLSDSATVKNYSEENWRDFFNGLFTTTSANLNPLSSAMSLKRRLLTSGALDSIPLALYE